MIKGDETIIIESMIKNNLEDNYGSKLRYLLRTGNLAKKVNWDLYIWLTGL